MVDLVHPQNLKGKAQHKYFVVADALSQNVGAKLKITLYKGASHGFGFTKIAAESFYLLI